MRKFQPIPNVAITHATCPQQAEAIVTFLNRHATDLPGGTFYRRECIVYVQSIKQSQISYVQGVIAGYLLSK